MIGYIDLETYSEVPLNDGTFKYAENAEIMLVSYALNDAPALVWDVTEDDRMPGGLQMILEDEDVDLVAHNVGFDRTVMNLSITSAFWPRVADHRWRCTMAQAFAHSLPGALGKLGEVFGVQDDHIKLKDGKKLIQLFCKPRPKNMTLRRATSFTHPEDWERFVEYARVDVEGMRDLYKKLPTWNYRGDELALWHLDQRVNARGFAVDLDLAHAAIAAVDVEQDRLAGQTHAMTEGAVAAATQRDKLLAYVLAEYDIDLPDMQGATIERRIADEGIPEGLRELLRVRLMSSTSSTSKYQRLIKSVSADGRLRGTLQFCGAARTGRWAGRTFQPHNLPRPNLKNARIEQGIEALKAGAVDLITDNVMEMTSNAIRGCIVAAPGRKLVVSDLSNIEGRGLAWMASERWKLDAFRAYDAGTGPDLYVLAYSKSFGVPIDDVTKDARQLGKVQELALGFQGGVGAFVTMAATYRMDLDAMHAAAWPAIPNEIQFETEWFWQWAVKNKKTLGLPEHVFRVCDALKRLWRNAHPATVKLWDDLEAGVRDAIESPGKTVAIARFKALREGAWLRLFLPSGRALCYPSPRVDDRGGISYMGVNQYTRRWSRIKTYGGKFAENADQAFSRDVLAHGMQPAEDAGYPIVLTVHDELITEPLDTDSYGVAALSKILATPPAWAHDIPLAAAGFEGQRYRKD